MKLSRDISTVKLEIDIPVLFELFKLLSENDRQDIVRRFLIQLKNEEYINDEDINRLATDFELGSPLFWQ